jgi:deoxyribodipyrimidine photolyase
MNDKILVWIHEDAISQNHPVFKVSEISDKNNQANIYKIFVWNKNYFKKKNYSLKRLVFIYESLLEEGFQIVADDSKNEQKIEEILINFCLENGVKKIYSAKTLDIDLTQIQKNLSAKFDHQIIADEIFVDVDEKMKFNRFFNYWKKASKTAFGNYGNSS